jgi:hypothetical protein
MTEQKKTEELKDDELDAVQGGALRLGGGPAVRQSSTAIGSVMQTQGEGPGDAEARSAEPLVETFPGGVTSGDGLRPPPP